MKERWGKVRISQKHYDTCWSAMNKQHAFIPYRIEFDGRDRCWEVAGKWFYFKEVAEGIALREYFLTFETLDDGNGTVVLKKVE